MLAQAHSSYSARAVPIRLHCTQFRKDFARRLRDFDGNKTGLSVKNSGAFPLTSF
jgi:hypothetical protein